MHLTNIFLAIAALGYCVVSASIYIKKTTIISRSENCFNFFLLSPLALSEEMNANAQRHAMRCTQMKKRTTKKEEKPK
jgi:hypothetical protein